MKTQNLFLVLSFTISASVSADSMNLNELAPTHLEDASPVEEHSLVFQMSGRFEKALPDELTWRPDVRYGATKKLQLEAQADILSGGDETRNDETKFIAQYQVNDSDSAVPVFTVTPFLSFPTGKFTRGIDPGAKLILTSTLSGTQKKPDTQIHLNYQLRHNSSRRPRERADEGLYALGMSQRVKEKTTVVADIIHQDDEEKDSYKDFVEAGLHQEALKGLYVSFGAGKGIGPNSADWMAAFGMEWELK